MEQFCFRLVYIITNKEVSTFQTCSVTTTNVRFYKYRLSTIATVKYLDINIFQTF